MFRPPGMVWLNHMGLPTYLHENWSWRSSHQKVDFDTNNDGLKIEEEDAQIFFKIYKIYLKMCKWEEKGWIFAW